MQNILPLAATKSIALYRTLPEDVEQIMATERAHHKYVSNYSKEKHLSLLSDEDCLHICIRSTEHRAYLGFVVCFGLSSAQPDVLIQRIALQHTNLGYGRQALSLLLNYCFTQRKSKLVWLDVYTFNERAIHLYEDLGFRKIGMKQDEKSSLKKEPLRYLYELKAEQYVTVL